MNNIGLANMAKELKRLNPAVQFDVLDYSLSPVIIVYGTVPGEQLVLPDGYYYNQKNGITDKHNTESGLYECFEYQYDTSHFKSKKSIFSRVMSKIFPR